MPRSSKHEIERYYFEEFIKARRLPLPGSPIYGDKPDVILDGTRRIGVEITNFYVADGSIISSEQRQSELRETVVTKAQALYRHVNKKNVELLFGFDKSHPIGDKKAQNALAKKMAELAEQVDGQEENGQISEDVFEHIPELSFSYLLAYDVEYTQHYDPKFPDGPPEGFADFKEYRNRQEECKWRYGIRRQLQHTAKWRVLQVHSYGLMSMERLVRIIKEKETKAKGYATCDAYWLLVVVDFINPAQEQEIRIDGFDSLHSDVFEKLIVYRTGFGHILENNNLGTRPV